jgi:hypothetical protein
MLRLTGCRSCPSRQRHWVVAEPLEDVSEVLRACCGRYCAAHRGTWVIDFHAPTHKALASQEARNLHRKGLTEVVSFFRAQRRSM